MSASTRFAVPLVALLAALSGGCATSQTAGPCGGIDCGGHGSCRVAGGRAACDCDPGYHPSPDSDALCVPDEPSDADADADADSDSDAIDAGDGPSEAGDGAETDGAADADAEEAADSDADAEDGATEDAPPVCGDGVTDPDEECDDGDADDADGCDRTCRVTGVDEAYLQVRDVPSRADRLFLALDGAGLPAPAVLVQATMGAAIVNVRFPVGAGGPYRVRVVAVVGSGFPSVLAGGRVEGLVVPAGGAVGGVVLLSPTTFEVDPSTPATARVGTPFTIAMRVTDPARALEGRTSGRLWSAAETFEDVEAAQTGGTLGPGVGDERSFVVTVTAGNPNVERTMYYQFGESASGFEFGGEVPFVVRPSTLDGEDLLLVRILRSNSGMRITVRDAPPEATRIFVSVDGAPGMPEALRVDDVPTGGRAVFELAMAAGAGYRVRGIATVGDGTFPIVLAGGHAGSLVVPSSPPLEVDVPVSAPGYTILPPTPPAVPVGIAYDVAFSIDDPADSLDGVTGGRVYWAMSPFAGDLGGTAESGSLSREGPERFRALIHMPPPSTEGTLRFQFAESCGSAFGRSGTVAPFVALPAVAAGQPLETITVTPPAQGIDLSASPVPAGAALVIVVVDGGSITPARFEVIPSGGAASRRLGLPAGGPFRVRVAAIREPTGFPPLLGGGLAEGVVVGAGAFTPVAVTLAAPVLTVDPATPSSAPPSSAVTIVLHVGDPGRFLGSRTSGRLWSDTAPFGNLAADQDSGTVTEEAPGRLRFSISVTTPAARGTLYYQFGESGDGPWGTPLWAPFLVLPDTTSGGALLEMRIE